MATALAPVGAEKSGKGEVAMQGRLSHLKHLEAEAIHILREVAAEFTNPVLLFSAGKDSMCMTHLARKAFYPAKVPMPLLHINTTWDFKDLLVFRDEYTREHGLDLRVYTNEEALAEGYNPWDMATPKYSAAMQTQALVKALRAGGFDAAFGGARRDEEKARAKERVYSFRNAQMQWDPKNQRPELWNVYNGKVNPGESIRVFPLSNWTELDVWCYIHMEKIPLVPMYFAKKRSVVERNGVPIVVDDPARMRWEAGEVAQEKVIRFRTLGDWPLTGGVYSAAATVPEIIEEMILAKTSERQGRVIDRDEAGSMEVKKREGYF